MIPTTIYIKDNLILNLIVIVKTKHLISLQAITCATTTTTTAKATIISVVGISKQHESAIVLHNTSHNAPCIAVLITNCEVSITKKSLVHAWLDTKVEDSTFITIVNTSHTSHIRLLIISPYLLNDRCREVLQGSLGITCHKLLTINLDLLYLLTIDGDLTIFINLCTWQTLYEFLNNRTLWSAIGSSIIYKGIFLYNKLLSHALSHNFLQHHGISSHIDVAESHVLRLCHGNVTIHIGIANVGHSQNVLSVLWGCYLESTVLCRCSTSNKRGVSLEQLDCCLHKRLFCLFVEDCAAYHTILCHCTTAYEHKRSKR